MFAAMPNSKPFVAVAAICEKVLHEKDGVLSVIRIVDTFYVQPPSDVAPNVVPSVRLNALVSLKSGDVIGESDVSFKFRTPGGRTLNSPERFPVLFNGGEHGVNVITTFTLQLPAGEAYGLYWFDVLWNSEVLTSVPFKLVLGSRPQTAETPG